MTLMKESDFLEDDYIGLASLESQLASEAIDAGDFDKAWGHYQRVIFLRAKNAEKYKFTRSQTIAATSSVHIAMARMLKTENRHHEALIHILYYVAGSNNAIADQIKIYRPYVNRCKFSDINLAMVSAKLEEWKEEPDIRQIRDTVAKWKSSNVQP